MNKKHLLLSIIALALPVFSWAGPVSQDEARQKAAQFLAKRLRDGRRKAPALGGGTMTLAASDKAYYAFNLGRGDGFVLMSASDLTQQVIGYADHGTFDLDKAPAQFKAWMARLSEVIDGVESGTARPVAKAAAIPSTASPTKSYIPTLVSSRWNQGDPYNLDCPTYVDGNGQTQTCATGCVATAMSQIMYFWKCPKTATPTIPAYSTSWNNTQRTYDALPPTTFKWDSMTDTYSSGSSQDSRKAVAELMRYVGQSLQMGYGPSSGAGAGGTARALKTYFGYDQALFYASHDDYSYQAWEDLIYKELASGRPVLMNGDTSDLTGGHEWVCDGYDGNGLFHMNWGWGGMCDGYFLLTVMFPDQQGIGGSTSSDGYSMSQGIVVGLQPSTGAAEPQAETARTSIFNIRLNKNSYTRTSTSNNFFVPSVNYSAGTNMANAYDFEHVFTLYNAAGDIVQESIGSESFSISPGTYWPTRSCNLVFGKNLSDGTYFIRGRSRQKGTDEWIEDDKGAKNFIMAEIKDGTSLQLTVYPHASLSVSSLTMEGAGTVGTEQKVKAAITNNESTEYYQNTFLIVDGTWVSGNCIQIPAKATRDIYFKYKPTTAGEHTFQLSTSKNASDAFFTTKLTVSDAVTNNVSVGIKPLMTVATESNTSVIYGDKMRLSVTVTNKAANPYKSFVAASAWENDGKGVYWQRSKQSRDVSIEPGASVQLTFEFDVNLDGRYNFHVDTDNSSSANCGDYTFRRGITYWTADGQQNAAKYANGFEVTGDILAVAIPGSTSLPTVSFKDTPNANFVLYYDEGASVSSRVLNILKKKVNNIVFGSKAEQCVLDGDKPFFIPRGFTADKVTFSRSVSAAAKAQPTTLALPFAPDDVKEQGYEAYEFKAIDGTTLYFTPAGDMAPSRPYLLMPSDGTAGAASASSHDSSLAPVSEPSAVLSLSAADAEVEATEGMSVFSTNYKFVGTAESVVLNGVYTLSADGKSFVLADEATVAPSTACFVANNAESSLAKSLTIDLGTPTSIDAIADGNGATGVQPAEGEPIFSIDGTRVGTYRRAGALDALPGGVYVIGGRKYVK